MDYNAMLATIKKYLQRRYSYEIINKLRNGKPFTAERKDLHGILLIDEEIMEILIEKMHEDGYIKKDDGGTITFSMDWLMK